MPTKKTEVFESRTTIESIDSKIIKKFLSSDLLVLNGNLKRIGNRVTGKRAKSHLYFERRSV